jgi:hypothetical protein
VNGGARVGVGLVHRDLHEGCGCEES